MMADVELKWLDEITSQSSYLLFNGLDDEAHCFLDHFVCHRHGIVNAWDLLVSILLARVLFGGSLILLVVATAVSEVVVIHEV